MNIDLIRKKLEMCSQQQVLRFYDELGQNEKNALIEQINSIDEAFWQSASLNQDSVQTRGKIEPINAVSIKDIAENSEEYMNIGVDALKGGKVAAVLLAGGQGTRLGFDKPKGMFNIGVNKELYIFECLINNLMKVVKLTDSWIPLCIMTSEKNNADTVSFFKEKNYFGYNSDHIHFFIQEMAPSVDYSGKILLESKGRISTSPKGNGGWYASLKKSNILDKLVVQGVEWLNVFSVDNVLQKIADPMFIGAVIKSGCKSGSKVVAKKDPHELVGAMCLEDGKPSIVEYFELTEEMAVQRLENGELAYKYGVILNYLFNINELETISKAMLPLHIVEKKIPYIDENGELQNPAEPNGYKFETLILDMIHMSESCLPYEVERNKEFAPVKNAEGVDSVETARALLAENNIEF